MYRHVLSIKEDIYTLIIYKINILGGFGDAKQTIRIPINMAKVVNIPIEIVILIGVEMHEQKLEENE
ncbi:hypothetical protein I4U23_022464 [Adineta vaga]|nr:hypothetical protein I4U23_022464 [Adineta vaga]